MKSGYRSRKLILQAIKHQVPKQESRLQTNQQRIIETPSRFPPNRIIIRNNKKAETDNNKLSQTKMEKHKQYSAQSQFQHQFHQSHVKAEEDQLASRQEYLEARDRRTYINYEFKDKNFELQKEKERLYQWLGSMHFKVVSASFNLYLTNELTFEEVKVHCCENLLLNILSFFENLTQKSINPSNTKSLASSVQKKSKVKMIPLSYLQLTQILKEMNQTLVKNLAYMQIKYPLTKDTKPNKALQSLISKINNLGNDEHDMIMKSGVQFKIKKQDNYTPQIMKLLNFIITKQSEPCQIKGRNNKQLTYFQYFYQTIESIFTSVYKPDYEQKQNDKQSETQKNVQVQAVQLFANILSNKAIAEIDTSQFVSKQAKQYKQKVMKYTHYLIGRKISQNTQLYSQKQIQTEIFDVRNSSILRILTKWTQELQNKVINAEETILKRPFRFKKNTPYEYSKLSANQKNDLYQQTKRRAKDVKLFNQQLQQNYNQIQSMLCSHLQQTEAMKNIPKNEYKVGYFCSKAQVAASSTLLSYLNKMIHILLLIPEQLKKNHFHDEEYIQCMDINLITFKIADLFRCKIKSREAQIIRIFKQIKKISQVGEPFKIVRIKDRLNLGTRDILINILFMNIFLCQIQLAVEEYVDAKQLSYDSFSHFLYELHRSRLGPIMQSACTWAQFDQRSKIFRGFEAQRSIQQRKQIIHNCQQQFLISNKYPFVCTLCQKFYSTQEGLLSHVKCNLCRTYFQCSVCKYSKMKPLQIANLIQLPEKLTIFFNQFLLWNYVQGEMTSFPKFGLLTSKKMKKPQIVFFQTIIFKFDCYILRVIQESSQSEDWNIQIIEKIEGNTPKGWLKVVEKYIIYDWKEKRAINKTITPYIMVQEIQKQKRIKDQATKAKKQQKERKREQLLRRRKQQENENSDQEEQQDKKKNKKQKQESSPGEQKNKNQKEAEKQQQKTIRYHESISKKNERLKVRVIEKTSQTSIDILVLGIYLKQSAIRNKLKEMNNKNILQKIGLKKIEVLFFEDQYIHDELNSVEVLTQAQKVQLKQTFERVSEVYLDNNLIQYIDFFESMISLKVAHLSHNNISDLTPLKDLRYLTQLVLQNNRIQSLEGLRNKPDIIELNLNRNYISSLSFFSDLEQTEFKHLRNLYANGNQIYSLQGLQKLTSLRKLDLSYNKIEEISEISTLVYLQQLDLSKNKLTKLKNIQHFSSLKKLFLNENKIKKLSKKISQLVFLNVLELFGNKIKKIQNLNTGAISKSLKVLNLSHNFINKMQGLDGLQNLQILNLNKNQIQNIDNYLDLMSLVKLDLSHNALQDIDLDDTQKYLPCLKQLYLNSNPINNSQRNKRVLVSLMKHIAIIKVVFKPQKIFQIHR